MTDDLLDGLTPEERERLEKGSPADHEALAAAHTRTLEISDAIVSACEEILGSECAEELTGVLVMNTLEVLMTPAFGAFMDAPLNLTAHFFGEDSELLEERKNAVGALGDRMIALAKHPDVQKARLAKLLSEAGGVTALIEKLIEGDDDEAEVIVPKDWAREHQGPASPGIPELAGLKAVPPVAMTVGDLLEQRDAVRAVLEGRDADQGALRAILARLDTLASSVTGTEPPASGFGFN